MHRRTLPLLVTHGTICVHRAPGSARTTEYLTQKTKNRLVAGTTNRRAPPKGSGCLGDTAILACYQHVWQTLDATKMRPRGHRTVTDRTSPRSLRRPAAPALNRPITGSGAASGFEPLVPSPPAHRCGPLEPRGPAKSPPGPPVLPGIRCCATSTSPSGCSAASPQPWHASPTALAAVTVPSPTLASPWRPAAARAP